MNKSKIIQEAKKLTNNTNIINNVAMIINTLPKHIPLPELCLEPDGDIGLDWVRSSKHIFSVSVGEGSRFPFAWMYDTENDCGVGTLTNIVEHSIFHRLFGGKNKG